MEYIIVIMLSMIPTLFLVVSIKKNIFTITDFVVSEQRYDNGEIQHGYLANVRLWNKEKPGKTIFGTSLGTVILTNKHFYFISTIKHSSDRVVSDLLITGIIPDTIKHLKDKAAEAKSLSLSQLSAEGSRKINLNDILSVERVRKNNIAIFNDFDFLIIKYMKNYKKSTLTLTSNAFRSRFTALKGLEQELLKAIALNKNQAHCK